MGVSLSNKQFIQFLTAEEVLEIHAELIKRFGGPPGIRDMGLLESALYRPQSGYYSDLTEMAAALFESLIKNHPFVDGEKRVAYFACDIFLRLNGYKFQVKAENAYQFLIGLLDNNRCDLKNLHQGIKHTITTTT